MAQIREELVLVDKFTAQFSKYITQSEEAAVSTKKLKEEAQRASAQGKMLSESLRVASASARTTANEKRALAAAMKAAEASARAETAQIRLQREQQKQLEEQQRRLESSTDRMISSLKNLVGAYVGLQGFKAIVDLSDAMTQTTARLNMMNDGLRTTRELQWDIYRAAQSSRGAYQETADMVAKLGILAGDAFGSNAEIVAFAEQLNKQMTISGTGTAGRQAAMLQLTQAMSSGVLRGEELNSILEQTPTIAQAIAHYLGVSTGEMRDLASEGLITSQVVKNALLAAADETNKKFEEMPMTWAQVWTSFSNFALMALQPVLTGLNWLANHIEIIGPLVLGLAGAFVVFQIAANWTSIAAAATAAYQFVVNLLSIAFGVLSGNAAAASAAVMTFNSALLASPVTWIIMGLMLIVGALYAGVAAYNHFANASVSATGIIMGAIYTLGAFLGNSIGYWWNMFAAFANFIANVFNDPVAAVKMLFYDMALNVLGYISKIAHAIENLINAIPGVQVSLTSGIDGIYNTVSGWAAETKANSGWKEYVPKWEYKDYGEAFSSGYDFGAGLADKVGGFFGGGDFGFDASQALGEIPDIGKSLGDISGDTGAIRKAVNMAEEDIKMLVDMAERQYVAQVNLTAQSPVIQVTGQNIGSTEADRAALADALKQILVELRASGTTRAYARV